MQIRTQQGQLMYEDEFRSYIKAQGGPSWDTTTAEILETLGANMVAEGPQASGGTHYQYSQFDGIENIDGVWYTKYILGPVFVDGETTAAQQEAAYRARKDAEQARIIREQRNIKLTASDWTQVADAPVDKAAWVTYRQALRDISSQSDFPWTINWPNSP